MNSSTEGGRLARLHKDMHQQDPQRSPDSKLTVSHTKRTNTISAHDEAQTLTPRLYSKTEVLNKVKVCYRTLCRWQAHHGFPKGRALIDAPNSRKVYPADEVDQWLRIHTGC